MTDDTTATDETTEVRRGRGRPKSEAVKERVTVRLDSEVLNAYRATGDGWQTRINDALRRAMKLSIKKTK